MWWPSGKGQDMHIDVMAKPLYEIPLEARKGTPLEFLEDEEQVINVVPYTDYASILYLNEDFEGGETYFEDGQSVSPKTGFKVNSKHKGSILEAFKPGQLPNLNYDKKKIDFKNIQKNLSPLY